MCHEKLKEVKSIIKLIENEMNCKFTNHYLIEKDCIRVLLTDDNFEETIIEFSLEDFPNHYNIHPKNLQIANVLSKQKTRNSRLEPYEGEYIGVDESGKGDYFGPLVTAGFISNPQIDEELIELGVKDCKHMSDKMVRKLAYYIQARYDQRFNICEKVPEHYNREISELKLVNKNQKDLLADMHDQVIAKLLSMNAEVIGIVADAVDLIHRNKYMLYNGQRTIPAFETPKGENNIAVAAAGILARNKFLEWLEATSEQYNQEIPKGADFRAISRAKKIIETYERIELKKLVKVHFKTTSKVLM